MQCNVKTHGLHELNKPLALLFSVHGDSVWTDLTDETAVLLKCLSLYGHGHLWM